jgi:hypothetical protein
MSGEHGTYVPADLAPRTVAQLLADVLPLVGPFDDDPWEDWMVREDGRRAVLELARRAHLCEVPAEPACVAGES